MSSFYIVGLKIGSKLSYFIKRNEVEVRHFWEIDSGIVNERRDMDKDQRKWESRALLRTSPRDIVGPEQRESEGITMIFSIKGFQ